MNETLEDYLCLPWGFQEDDGTFEIVDSEEDVRLITGDVELADYVVNLVNAAHGFFRGCCGHHD